MVPQVSMYFRETKGDDFKTTQDASILNDKTIFIWAGNSRNIGDIWKHGIISC